LIEGSIIQVRQSTTVVVVLVVRTLAAATIVVCCKRTILSRQFLCCVVVVSDIYFNTETEPKPLFSAEKGICDLDLTWFDDFYHCMHVRVSDFPLIPCQIPNLKCYSVNCYFRGEAHIRFAMVVENFELTYYLLVWCPYFIVEWRDYVEG
jgi:hypothetical protein